MDFGDALVALKAGQMVRRSGWNGKGMFLYHTPSSDIPYENLTGNAAKYITAEVTGKETAHICGHIDMKAADGSVVIGWLASQTDMPANDWEEIEND